MKRPREQELPTVTGYGGAKGALAAIGAEAGSHVIVALGVSARAEGGGPLPRIGEAVVSLMKEIARGDAPIFRLAHGQLAILFKAEDFVLEVVEKACQGARAPGIEVRALVVEFDGGRDASWFEGVQRDIGSHEHFGTFVADRTTRFLDGERIVPG